MTDLDLAITATLRAEAREAEMSTNTPQQYELLSGRLDEVDRSRSRTRWLLTAAAVVLLGGAAWAVTSATQTSTAPPAATPSGPAATGMTFTAADMDPDTRVTLPGWTSSTDINWNSPRGAQFEQAQCAEPIGAPACSEDEDLKLRLETLVAKYGVNSLGTRPLEANGAYYGFVFHVRNMSADVDAVRIVEDRPTEVGGRPATLFTLEGLRDLPGAMGCPTTTSAMADCYPIVAGRTVRLAVVDQGESTPATLFYLSLTTGAADMAERFAEFDEMLSTVEFG